MPQQPQMSHRQVPANIQQQSLMPQHTSACSSSSLIIPQQSQIQQASHFIQHDPSHSISQKRSTTHTTSPIIEKTSRPYESAAKTAERAAAVHFSSLINLSNLLGSRRKRTYP